MCSWSMTAHHRADVQRIFTDFLVFHLRLLLARQVAHKHISIWTPQATSEHSAVLLSTATTRTWLR